jgi:CheY-like chemotaxis protein
VHGVENAPLHRLEPVAHVRQGPAHDHAHGVLEVGALHLVSLAHSMYQGKPMDGIKITQLLKADPATVNLPVILVTAHAMEGDRENFLSQSGADGYISKPVIDHQEFVDQIKATMGDSE